MLGVEGGLRGDPLEGLEAGVEVVGVQQQEATPKQAAQRYQLAHSVIKPLVMLVDYLYCFVCYGKEQLIILFIIILFHSQRSN